MLTKNTVYRTQTGRTVDLAKLNSDERACLAAVLPKYSKHPEWTRFGTWWMKELAKRGIEQKSALFKICDDLEARLGIAQGKTSPPDYRSCLLGLIEEQYGSRYRFCKETGIDQGQLSRILAGRADFSLESLGKVLRVLHASLVVQPDEAIRESAHLDEASRMLESASQ